MKSFVKKQAAVTSLRGECTDAALLWAQGKASAGLRNDG